MTHRRFVLLCAWHVHNNLVEPHQMVEVDGSDLCEWHGSDLCEWCADDGLESRGTLLVDLRCGVSS